MSSAVKGEDILKALSELKSPANLNEIVDHLLANIKESKTTLTEAVALMIEAGVRFGCILEDENKYRAQISVKDDQHVEPQGTELKNVDNKPASTYNELEYVMSNNELRNSSKTMAKQKKRTNIERIEHSISVSYSDDDEEVYDHDDCYGTRFRRSKRSRSRSSGKRRSSRRRRRRQ